MNTAVVLLEVKLFICVLKSNSSSVCCVLHVSDHLPSGLQSVISTESVGFTYTDNIFLLTRVDIYFSVSDLELWMYVFSRTNDSNVNEPLLDNVWPVE